MAWKQAHLLAVTHFVMVPNETSPLALVLLVREADKNHCTGEHYDDLFLAIRKTVSSKFSVQLDTGDDQKPFSPCGIMLLASILYKGGRNDGDRRFPLNRDLRYVQQ